MRAAQRGESDAFARLVVLYDADVRVIARGLIRDVDDAEDMRQEVWLRIAERISTAAPDTFRGWVRTIARNACLNFLRTHASHARVTDADGGARILLAPDEDASDAPEWSVLRQDARREVWEAVGGLSEDDRTVLRLRELEERSYEEIAALLRTTPHAAEVRTHRARGRLRRALERLVAAPRRWHLNPLKVTGFVDDAHDALLPDHVRECAACADEIATMRRGRDLFGGLGALLLLPRQVAALASRVRDLLSGDARVMSISNVANAPVAMPTGMFVQASGVAVTAAFAITAVLAPLVADAGLDETVSIEPEPVAVCAPAVRENDDLRIADVTVAAPPDAAGAAIEVEVAAVAEPITAAPMITTWSPQPATTVTVRMGASGPSTSTAAATAPANTTAAPKGTQERSAPAKAAVTAAASASGPKGATVSAAVHLAVTSANAEKETDEDRSSEAAHEEEHGTTSTSDARAHASQVVTAASTANAGPARPGTDASQHRGKP